MAHTWGALQVSQYPVEVVPAADSCTYILTQQAWLQQEDSRSAEVAGGYGARELPIECQQADVWNTALMRNSVHQLACPWCLAASMSITSLMLSIRGLH